MRASAYVMELDLEILSKWYDKKRTFIPLPKFAEEKRDLAFVMDKAITCGEIEDCIRKENKYVKEDVYKRQAKNKECSIGTICCKCIKNDLCILRGRTIIIRKRNHWLCGVNSVPKLSL